MEIVSTKKSGKGNFRANNKKRRFLCWSINMVVATKTSVGDVATVVKGMYDGHFGRVRGYTKHSVKLTLLHELVARLWAKMTANVKVTIQRTSVRVLNQNKVGQVASWEGNVVAVNERPNDPAAITGRGTEAGLLAGLVALHISAHPERLIEGRLAFQESLDGVIKAMARGPLLRNS
jgi:hypothetical protein